jgi:hypothetical protein
VLLRLAAAQRFLFDRIPPHAIVNESVNIARANRQSRQAAFVNAVVRKIVESDHLRQVDPTDRRNFLSITHSQPPWLIELLERKFGAAALEPLLAACNEEPRATLRVNRLKMSTSDCIDALADMGIGASPCALAPQGLVLEDAGPPARSDREPAVSPTATSTSRTRQASSWPSSPRPLPRFAHPRPLLRARRQVHAHRRAYRRRGADRRDRHLSLPA